MKVAVQIVVDAQGRFTALCPSLPGCCSKAQTREQAQQKLHEAIKGYLASVSNFVPENLEQEVLGM